MRRKDTHHGWKLTIKWVEHLWNEHRISCLPIRNDAKAPMLSINKFPDHIEPDVIRSFGTPNVAIRCGHINKLLVLDVDNPLAAKAWFAARRPLPPTWTARTGSGGMHIYLRVPETWNTPIHNVDLWKGHGKHEEVKLLGDRKHAIAPPSFYGPKHYKWINGLNPLQTRMAFAPYWLLKEMVDLREDARHHALPRPAISDNYTLPVGRQWRVNDTNLLDRIPDKMAVLIGYGLKVASQRPNASGWQYCYRPSGDDRHPSACVRPETGQIWIAGSGTLNFFEACVALGAFPDVQSAIKTISEKYR